MRLLLISIAFFTMTACFSAPVNRDEILASYSNINLTDGVSKDEMKIIAQRYLLITADAPCELDAQNVNIDSPHIKCSWIDREQKDGGCYVGFSPKAAFRLTSLYVKVSDVTGKASCAGYLVLK